MELKYEPWVQGYAEEPPLISRPWWSENSAGEVEERTVDSGAIGQIHPHITHLLCYKKTMSAIICMDHGDRITEPIGNFL